MAALIKKCDDFNLIAFVDLAAVRHFVFKIKCFKFVFITLSFIRELIEMAKTDFAYINLKTNLSLRTQLILSITFECLRIIIISNQF